MRDLVELCIDGWSVSHFLRYSINANMYAAAGSFDLELRPAAADVDVDLGSLVQIKVNHELALTGVVERINQGGRKSERYLRVGGRDLMGMVVSQHITTFRTLRNKSLSQVVAEFLCDIEHVKRSAVEYAGGAANLDVPQEYVQPEPGQTVFDLLHGIAVSRGLLFWCRPDGTFVFGRPAPRGDILHSVYNTKDGLCNVLDYDRVRDITDRASTITVLGQRQSYDGVTVAQLNNKGIATDDLPFERPFVAVTQTSAQTPAQQARMILEQQRFNGDSIRYTLPGHSQDGRNWSVGAMCGVCDEYLRVRGEYLIYARTYTLSKDEGARTQIQVGPPGVVQ